MKWTIAFLVVVGIAAALSAALLVASVRAGSLGAHSVEEVALLDQEILVATRALPAMTVLDARAVAKRTVPAGEAPLDAERNLTRVVGKVLLAPVVEGQVFTQRSFAGGESGVHVAAALAEGARAMSVFLSAESGIEQLLYPGCVVDVVASFRMPMSQGGQSGEIVSATLLQGVQVLALGPRTIVSSDDDGLLGSGGDPRAKRMVTLMVDSEQAEALQLAASHGEVTLAMRNPLDTSEAESSGVKLSELSERFADRLAAATPGPGPAATRNGPVWTTTVLRGREPETVTFPMEEASLDR